MFQERTSVNMIMTNNQWSQDDRNQVVPDLGWFSLSVMTPMTQWLAQCHWYIAMIIEWCNGKMAYYAIMPLCHYAIMLFHYAIMQSYHFTIRLYHYVILICHFIIQKCHSIIRIFHFIYQQNGIMTYWNYDPYITPYWRGLTTIHMLDCGKQMANIAKRAFSVFSF